MHCTDTDAKDMKAVRLEHLDTKTCSKLNHLIGVLKAGFRGNARVTLVLSGGHIDDMKINDASFDESILK